MKTGKLIQLSVQEMLECCPTVSPGPSKRDWFMALGAFNCMGGIESEETYPYRGGWSPGKLGLCRFDKRRSVAYLPSDDFWCVSGEARAAKALIESGPLANRMNASPRSFQFYSEGKYQNFQSLSHYE